MQETLHLEDDFGLVFQLGLQFSDLSLKLKRIFRNAVLIIDLKAFLTDLKMTQDVKLQCSVRLVTAVLMLMITGRCECGLQKHYTIDSVC